jgi:hypothetical protein
VAFITTRWGGLAMKRASTRIMIAIAGIAALSLALAAPQGAQGSTHVLYLHDFEGTGAWCNCHCSPDYRAKDWMDTTPPSRLNAVSGSLENTGYGRDRCWYLEPALLDTMDLEGGTWSGSFWLSGPDGYFDVVIMRVLKSDPCQLLSLAGNTPDHVVFPGSTVPTRVDFNLSMADPLDLGPDETLLLEINWEPENFTTLLWWDGQDYPSHIQTGPAAPFDPDASSAVTAAPGRVSVFTTPDMAGDPLVDCQAYGAMRTDATITVTLIGNDGSPMVGVPATSIWLRTTAGGLVVCPGGSIADGPTDGSGRTTFSQAIAGGGYTNPGGGERTEVVAMGAPLAQKLDIQFNSADISGNLVVNIADVALFAGDWMGPYAYRSDFYWDGLINLSDLVQLAHSYGAACPPAPPAGGKRLAGDKGPASGTLPPRAGRDLIGLYADPAGERTVATAAPGEPFVAYLLLKDPSRTCGIRGWECWIEISDNIRVLDWQLAGQAINVMQPPEFVVGLGSPLDSEPVVQLARARCLVTDERPATLAMRGARQDGPVYVLADGSDDPPLAGLQTLTADGDETTLRVNPAGEAPISPLPERVQLHTNVPNPFNPQTLIRFDLPRSEHVRLSVYTVDGRRLATLVDEPRPAGSHAVIWNGVDDRGRRVASGTYYYRLEAGDFGQTRPMVLLK